VTVNLEFWHFDCSEIETAHRILPSFFRSTTGVQDFSVWNRSFDSISGFADASQRRRFFSGTVSSLHVLYETPVDHGSTALRGPL